MISAHVLGFGEHTDESGGPPAPPPPGLDAHILQARALWLVGVCGEELGHEPWDEAFGLCAAHISSPDLVVRCWAPEPGWWDPGVAWGG